MLHHITAQAFIAHALTITRSVNDSAKRVADEIVPMVTYLAPDALPSFERVIDGTDVEALAEIHDIIGEGSTQDEMVMAVNAARELATAYSLLAVRFRLPNPVNFDEVQEAMERMKIIAQSF